MKKIARVIAGIMLALSMTFATAADNSIYIDQAVDNSTIVVTQDGAGNIVRGIQGAGTGNTTPAIVRGDGNQITISQIGSGSVLNFGIRTTIAAGVQGGNNFIYSVTGNNATATINSNNAGTGVSGSNNISVTQSGNSANANINVLGSANNLTAVTSGGASNSVVSTIDGDNNTQTISMTGGGNNSATLTQTGDKGTISLTSVGASNTYTVTQTGGSTVGHNATLDVNGSSNTFGITQTGTSGDNIANIKSVGNTNTFTVNQTNH